MVPVEGLGVLVGKDATKADAKLNTAHVQKCYTWTQSTSQLMPFLIPFGEKKRKKDRRWKVWSEVEANRIGLLFLMFRKI